MKSLEIQRLSFLGFAHFAALLVGIYAVHLETVSTQRGMWMLNWGIGFALVLACAADAKTRKRPVVRIVQFLMLLFWPLAVPVYCVVARRWVGLLWAMLFVITLLICYGLGFAGTFLLTDASLEEVLAR